MEVVRGVCLVVEQKTPAEVSVDAREQLRGVDRAFGGLDGERELDVALREEEAWIQRGSMGYEGRGSVPCSA